MVVMSIFTTALVRSTIKRKERGTASMRINTKCSIALHCLVLIAQYQDITKVTSEILSKSTGCNAAAIRSILTTLQKADILRIHRGVGGAYLNRKPDDLTIWDVYYALEPEGLDHFIGLHPHPYEKCPVGNKIHSVLHHSYQQIGDAVRESMQSITLQQLLDYYRTTSVMPTETSMQHTTS